ncbi:MAG: preprotein translocase subunit SecE [Bryobacterales bacterium]|nr:preprotein translocase subunit SecE [Bryobacterales bacterium]MDE0296549.1 preprotein translocase subunit SecE [Bryobacterales bacterium]
MASIAKSTSRGTKAAARSGPSGWLQKIQGWPADLRNYIEGLKREMRLVTWPNRRQVQATTVVVLVTVFFFGLFFFVVDYMLTLGQTNLYERFTQ